MPVTKTTRKSAGRRSYRNAEPNDTDKVLETAVVYSVSGPPLVTDDRGRSQLGLRSRLQMNRESFARLVPISVRHLASIEGGKPPSENVGRRLIELQRLVDALSEVVQVDTVGPWLNQPNQAFDGLKPIEVLERGEADRIWQMVFYLRSGATF